MVYSIVSVTSAETTMTLRRGNVLQATSVCSYNFVLATQILDSKVSALESGISAGTRQLSAKVQTLIVSRRFMKYSLILLEKLIQPLKHAHPPQR